MEGSKRAGVIPSHHCNHVCAYAYILCVCVCQLWVYSPCSCRMCGKGDLHMLKERAEILHLMIQNEVKAQNINLCHQKIHARILINLRIRTGLCLRHLAHWQPYPSHIPFPPTSHSLDDHHLLIFHHINGSCTVACCLAWERENRRNKSPTLSASNIRMWRVWKHDHFNKYAMDVHVKWSSSFSCKLILQVISAEE